MRFLLALLIGAAAYAQQTSPPPATAAQTPAATQTPAADQKPAAAADQKPAEAAKPESPTNPAPPRGEWFTGSIDLGYRFVDVGGNSQQYRSVVDLLERPTLLGLDLNLVDASKRFFDTLHVNASGWGGEQYNTAHLDARKLGKYDFNFDYRNIAYFSESPSFANPRQPAGLNEQSLDIRRRMMDISLDLFPGGHFVPFLGFNHNSGNGAGIETWVNEASNEYPVPYTLRDGTNNYRGGVRVEYSRFHLTLAEGGTTYKDDDATYETQPQPGDRTAPLLGQTLALNGLAQAYGIRGTSTYSQALLTASPTSWLNVYGQFLFSEPKTTVHFNEAANGNFVEISSLLFYTGSTTVGTGNANQPHTTGNFGFELRPMRRLRIVESVMTDRYHDAASPFITTTLLLTASAPQTAANALNYSQIVNYNQQQVNVFYDLTNKLTVRGGYRFVWGDATVLAGQLSQTGPLANGELRRNVGIAGLTYRASEKLSLNLDYEGASSDRVYFRTSLNDYHRARARARYQLNSALGFQANFTVLNNQNPDPSIRYDFQSRDNSVAVFWTPRNSKRISFTGEYDRETLRSSIAYLGLFLAPGTSLYRENGHIATSAANIVLPHNGKLTFGGSVFVSAGSRPTRLYEPLVQVSLPFTKHIYWNTEWQYFGYGESLYSYEGFRARVLTTGIRLIK